MDSDTKEGHLIVTHALSAGHGSATEDGTGRGTPLVVAPIAGGNYGQGNSDEGVPNLVVGALSAGAGTNRMSPGHDRDDLMVAGASVRRLTPTECERLQGFPDGWTFGSDSARYRQLGNAVCVPVAAWLGRRLASVDATAEEQRHATA